MKGKKRKYDVCPESLNCIKCGTTKPFTIEFFSKKSNNPYGLAYVCKECDKIRRKVQFEKHRLKETSARKLWRLRNKESGLCTCCSKKRLPTSNNFCEEHFFRNASSQAFGTTKHWKFLQELLIKQNYQCAYSGMFLVPGTTASLDHKKPQSKYPELKNDLNNVQWVDWGINQMKRSYEEKEFLDLCKLITIRAEHRADHL